MVSEVHRPKGCYYAAGKKSLGSVLFNFHVVLPVILAEPLKN
jgi:hypothetical protein